MLQHGYFQEDPWDSDAEKSSSQLSEPVSCEFTQCPSLKWIGLLSQGFNFGAGIYTDPTSWEPGLWAAGLSLPV